MMEELEEVEMEVNKILKALYRKDGGTNRTKLKKYGLDKEAINWGDLGVVEVWYKPEGCRYLVIIDEADPSCGKFQGYISSEMRKKGFNVEVVTEW